MLAVGSSAADMSDHPFALLRGDPVLAQEYVALAREL
jgi:hypothetical protein